MLSIAGTWTQTVREREGEREREKENRKQIPNYLHVSALPSISASFPPEMLRVGTPKFEISMGRHIPGNSGFLLNFHRNPWSGNSGRFILGTPFWQFGGIFWKK